MTGDEEKKEETKPVNNDNNEEKKEEKNEYVEYNCKTWSDWTEVRNNDNTLTERVRILVKGVKRGNLTSSHRRKFQNILRNLDCYIS